VVGDKTPTGTAYYLLRQGEGNVVVVSSASIENLTALLDQPPISTPTAVVTPGTIGTPGPIGTEVATPLSTASAVSTPLPSATP
jgi:hypothetical protein